MPEPQQVFGVGAPAGGIATVATAPPVGIVDWWTAGDEIDVQPARPEGSNLGLKRPGKVVLDGHDLTA